MKHIFPGVKVAGDKLSAAVSPTDVILARGESTICTIGYFTSGTVLHIQSEGYLFKSHQNSALFCYSLWWLKLKFLWNDNSSLQINWCQMFLHGTYRSSQACSAWQSKVYSYSKPVSKDFKPVVKKIILNHVSFFFQIFEEMCWSTARNNKQLNFQL